MIDFRFGAGESTWWAWNVLCWKCSYWWNGPEDKGAGLKGFSLATYRIIWTSETNFLKCGNGFMVSDCSCPQEMHAEIFRVKFHGVSNQFYFGKREMYVWERHEATLAKCYKKVKPDGKMLTVNLDERYTGSLYYFVSEFKITQHLKKKLLSFRNWQGLGFWADLPIFL